jgi:hypothetical protein
VVFAFASINKLLHLLICVYVEPSLYACNETNFVMVNDPSDMLLDSLCHYLLMIFPPVFTKEIGL